MRRDAFTLIEVLIVALLIGIAATVLLPRLGPGFSQKLDHGAEVLAADLRYANQRAVATGRMHRWTIDLTDQLFRIEEQVRHEVETALLPTHADLLDLSPPRPDYSYQPVGNSTGGWRWLAESGVVVEEVAIGEDQYQDGLVSIAFSGDGGADPAQIVMSDEYGYRAVVRLLAFSGEVRIEDPFAAP